jgi:peroxiredoxin
MLKDLKPGDVFPDFELPDENGEPMRLSELQGDDVMVLMLGRGEHCPRERQHQREMLKFYEWCSVAFTQIVTVLPNDLHDVYKLRISTGAHWTFLADRDLEVQHALDIREYTDPHHDATVPAHGRSQPRTRDREDLRGLLVLGPVLPVSALAGPRGDPLPDEVRFRPDDRRGTSCLGSGPGGCDTGVTAIGPAETERRRPTEE